jgi:hypothetical protein
MTISLALTPELEQRLKQAAEQQGLSADVLAVLVFRTENCFPRN